MDVGAFRAGDMLSYVAGKRVRYVRHQHPAGQVPEHIRDTQAGVCADVRICDSFRANCGTQAL